MGKKILYAEDAASNLKFLYYHLTHAGYQCDTAEDGKKALEAIHNGNYSLIILDLHMPYFNGDEIVEIIRKEGNEVPVFCLTSDDSNEEELLKKGFSHIFIKTAQMDKLFDAVRLIMDK